MARILSKVKLDALEELPIKIPEYERSSPPFSAGKSIKVYSLDELKKKAVTKQFRTDWFEKKLFAIWREIGKPVPYAFRTADGTPRSLDAGCLGFLFNTTTPDLIPYVDPVTGKLDAVEPTGRLATLYRPLEEALRSEIRPLSTRSDVGQHGMVAEQEGSQSAEMSVLELGFDLNDAPDERRIELSKRAIREGAAAFRKEQMGLWAGRCAATGCDVKQTLEAAHIFRYLGGHTNRPDNGIILRADIHKLFDKNLVGLETRNGVLLWRVSAQLKNTDYAKIHGKHAISGPHIGATPHPAFVARHFKDFRT